MFRSLRRDEQPGASTLADDDKKTHEFMVCVEFKASDTPSHLAVMAFQPSSSLDDHACITSASFSTVIFFISSRSVTLTASHSSRQTLLRSVCHQQQDLMKL